MFASVAGRYYVAAVFAHLCLQHCELCPCPAVPYMRFRGMPPQLCYILALLCATGDRAVEALWHVVIKGGESKAL